MAKRRTARQEPSAPTPYEAEQLRLIAAWKREKPGFARRLVSVLSASIEKWTQRIVPDAASRLLMETLNAIAEQLVADRWVLKTAGVASYAEMVKKPGAACVTRTKIS